MTTQFTGGGTSNLDALTVSGATTLSSTTTFGSAPMATPSGTAPVFGVRAWCVFNGTLTGTNAPIAGGNVTSVTRNAAGDYTINFTTAMPDANYGVMGSVQNTAAAQFVGSLAIVNGTAPTASAVRVGAFGGGGASFVLADSPLVTVAILR